MPAPAGSTLRPLVCCALLALSAVAAPAAVHADEASAQAAMAALKVAKHYYDGGQFDKAAERFHEAWKIDQNPAFLFNAARAEMRAFQLDKAEADFNQYLALTGIAGEGRRRAQVHLEEIGAQRKMLANKAATPASGGAAGSSAGRVNAAVTGTDWLGIGLWTGTGVALLAAGGLYASARSARDETNKTVVSNEQQLAAHKDDVASQNQRRNIAIGVAAVGAGLGVWAFLRSSPASGSAWQLSPWSSGRGLALQAGF